MNLFCDIDGTFWEHTDLDFVQYKKNLKAAERWRAAGHVFGLATGRGIPSMRRNFPDYHNHADFLITDNGSFTTETKTEKLIDEIVFETRQIAQILSFVRTIFNEEEAKVSYHGYLQEYQVPIAAIGKIRVWLLEPRMAEKLYFEMAMHFGNDDYKLHIERNALPSSLKWVGPKYKSFINIVPAESGKETAITRLKKQRKITGDVIVLGDDMNDLAMIQKYDGYAMANSHPKLLEKMSPDHIVKNPEALIRKLLK